MPGAKLWNGNADAVVEAMRPFAPCPDFLKYGNGMAKSKVCSMRLIEARFFWRAMKAVHPKLTWSQNDIAAILKALAAKQEAVWLRTLEEHEV